MSNLLSIGSSGLSAAQIALNTVGNNITNVNTTGYSRQTVVQTEAISGTGTRYTTGSGVDVQSVQRAYSSYLTSAMWTANSSMQSASTTNDLATTLNNVLSATSLQSSMDSFYSAFSTLANASGSTSSRQALLGSASSLVTMFNTLGQQLQSQQSQVNSQITSTVNSINSVASNIASLNSQIAQAGSNVPNDLLDQRDNLVQTLSGYLGVSTSTQPDGTISIYATNGQALVSGSTSYALSSGNNAYDSSQTDVFDSTGTDISNKVSGGTLGALLNYRTNTLQPVQNQLGQVAIAMASGVNSQQAQGLDANGNQGSAMFSVPSPAVLASSANKGSATVSASISDVSKLTTSDYVMTYDGSNWNLQTTSGQSVTMTTNPDGSLSADGLTISVSGTPQAGDSYEIQPTRQAASGLGVSMTSANGIAAAALLGATASSSNTGSGAISSVSITDPSNSALTGAATLTFPTASSYQVTDSSGNVISSGSYTAGQTISANGWSVTPSGTPAANDSFSIGLNSNGLNDTSNALTMSGLADSDVLNGGSTSVTDAFSQLTTTVGNAGSQASTNLTTQTSLYNQAVSAQQSVSGVNLDEEAADLVKYQQAYQASAQVISTAQTIFASLITAIQS
ncbi:flagellar hook-associated protein FlgK [Dyella sp. C9]|uniref:flagellar hook-associated protein FlgK n=1 Tax=Dyella sp. C9 TaxID=2202154 RepID=UPI000DEF73E0|nr:flagellar hook-associated protein FlgK [Dyella sp. C9]